LPTLPYYTRPDTQHAQLRRRTAPDAAPAESQLRPTEQPHPTTQLTSTLSSSLSRSSGRRHRTYASPPNQHGKSTMPLYTPQHAPTTTPTLPQTRHSPRKEPPPPRRKAHPPKEVNPTTTRRRSSPRLPLRTKTCPPPPPRRMTHPPREVNHTTTRRPRTCSDTQSDQPTRTLDLHPTRPVTCTTTPHHHRADQATRRRHGSNTQRYALTH
jgi:hypothetical protein